MRRRVLAFVGVGALAGLLLTVSVLVVAAVPVPVLDAVRDAWWHVGWTYEPP